MQVLVMVLNQVDSLEDILDAMNNIGIKGATVIDSQGMARVLGGNNPEKLPLFGSLSMFINDNRPYNKTIFVVLRNNQVTDAIDAIKSVVGDLTKPDVGIVFTLPVGHVEGVDLQ